MHIAKSVYHAARVFNDVDRLDDVIALAETLAGPRLTQNMVKSIQRDPQGARALAEKPRVRVNLRELAALPEGTLGRAFADFMNENKLDPSSLPNRPANTEGEFVRAHLPETHDIWHVVTGFSPDAVGELGLQAFYMAQLPTPLSPALIALALLKTMGTEEERIKVMDTIGRGWALGRQARPLFGVRWGELWERPLDEVRRELAITPVKDMSA